MNTHEQNNIKIPLKLTEHIERDDLQTDLSFLPCSPETDQINFHEIISLINSEKKNSQKLAEVIFDSIDINSKDQYGYTPLIHAVITGEEKTISLFLDQGADINSTDNDGNTPLICACLMYPKIAQLLIDRGASIQHKNKRGYDALFIATLNNQKEVVDILLSQEDINLNSIDTHNNTPLILAAEKGYLEITESLLNQEKIDINFQNKYGYTALMRACQNRYPAIIMALLKKQSLETCLVNAFHMTALMIAQKWSKPNEYLLRNPESSAFFLEKNKSGKSISTDNHRYCLFSKTDAVAPERSLNCPSIEQEAVLEEAFLRDGVSYKA